MNSTESKLGDQRVGREDLVEMFDGMVKPLLLMIKFQISSVEQWSSDHPES